MTCQRPLALTLIAGYLVFAATAARAQDTNDRVNPDAAMLLAFNERVEAYMELREDAVEEGPDAETVADPAKLRARENALAARIRAMRAGAAHGAIFTPDIRALFRRLLSRQATGERGDELRSTLKEDAPAPGAVPLEVNAKYPAGVPYVTTPPNVLRALPPLPKGLEYRFVGKDLILVDQPADVILDYIRNAVK